MRLRRIVSAFAAGRVLNAKTARKDDPHVNPIGAKGIGEIGIVGAPAIANAVYHATGKRVRDLPITIDKLL